MKVNRRKFIHLGAVGSATLALPDPLKLAQKQRKPWNEQSARVTRKHRNPSPTACSLCDNHCGLTAYREGDRVVMLLGNKEHPVAGGKLCAKAYGQLDRLYDPDRILKPRKRVGERGEGKWVDITWAEAYEMLQPKLTAAYNDGGANLAFINGRDELLTDSFLSLFPQSTKVEADDKLILSRFQEQIFGRTDSCHQYQDCRYVLNFAADPFRDGGAFISEVQSLIKGINENGLELVTIAGRLSQTGGKSRAWHPVHPRHYGDVAKAIASAMLEKGWYNTAGLSQSGIDVYELKSYLRSFAPASVSKETGVSVKVIYNIARQLGRRLPSLVIIGEEVFQTDNGWQNACAIQLLNVLCGALTPDGALKFADTLSLDGRNPAETDRSTVSAAWFFQKLKKERIPKLLISYQANPAFDSFNGKWWPRNLLKSRSKVSFYVAFDTYINETSQYADLILPMATELESWGLFSHRINQQQQCISLRQPVSRPTDEILLLRQAKIKKLDLFNPALAPVASSREFNQVALELGQAVQGDNASAPFKYADVESYLKDLVHNIPALAQAGGLAQLKKTGFLVYRDPARRSQPVALNIKDLGEGKPVARESYNDDDIYLIPFAWQVLDSQTANSKYLAELRHDNPLWLHPERARKLGLKDGEVIKIGSEIDEISVKVWVTQAVHPDCAAIAVGHGHSKIGRVALAQTIADYDPMTKSLLSRKNFFFTPFTFRLNSWDKKEPLWWHKKGNGAHVNSLVAGNQDGRNSGLTFINPLVKIVKG